MVEVRRLPRENVCTVLTPILAGGAICPPDLKQLVGTSVLPSTDKNVNLQRLSLVLQVFCKLVRFVACALVTNHLSGTAKEPGQCRMIRVLVIRQMAKQHTKLFSFLDYVKNKGS